MAEPQVLVQDDSVIDEEMGDSADPDAMDGAGDNGEPTGLESIEPTIAERTTFLDYLRSPIVELEIGSGAERAVLSAHQGLLSQSHFFASACEQFGAETPRRIPLPDDDLDATASLVEFLYKSDYFPTLSGQTMEYDPTAPQPDDGGIALLRHARVYTLAQRFGLPGLAALAHKKIHLTPSTAKGEIAYARFVYKETSPDDESIRKPVAAFWATRSHALRHEAELEFRRMCLEFPQFGFDVLNLVLDEKEKRNVRQEAQSGGGPAGRKRQRLSQANV